MEIRGVTQRAMALLKGEYYRIYPYEQPSKKQDDNQELEFRILRLVCHYTEDDYRFYTIFKDLEGNKITKKQIHTHGLKVKYVGQVEEENKGYDLSGNGNFAKSVRKFLGEGTKLPLYQPKQKLKAIEAKLNQAIRERVAK